MLKGAFPIDTLRCLCSSFPNLLFCRLPTSHVYLPPTSHEAKPAGMLSMKTIAASSIFAAAIFSDSTNAWQGSVTFYDGADFRGQPYTVNLGTDDRCFNIGCFNDRASSASWANLPISSEYGYGTVLIRFYTDKDCHGNSRQWRTYKKNFPSNFALDGINNAISSFIIDRNGGGGPPVDYCRVALAEDSGVQSNATESEASAVVLSEGNEASLDLDN